MYKRDKNEVYIYIYLYVCVCVCMYVCVRVCLPIPPHHIRLNLCGILTGLNPEFSFSKASCHTKAKEPSLPLNLPIAGGRIIGFIPFPRLLVLCEMQTDSPWIWTRHDVSISRQMNRSHETNRDISFILFIFRLFCF